MIVEEQNRKNKNPFIETNNKMGKPKKERNDSLREKSKVHLVGGVSVSRLPATKSVGAEENATEFHSPTMAYPPMISFRDVKHHLTTSGIKDSDPSLMGGIKDKLNQCSGGLLSSTMNVEDHNALAIGSIDSYSQGSFKVRKMISMKKAWEGVGVVASAHKLIGATNPLQAECNTIREDLAVQTIRCVKNDSLANIIKPNKFGSVPKSLVFDGLVLYTNKGRCIRIIKEANLLTTKEDETSTKHLTRPQDLELEFNRINGVMLFELDLNLCPINSSLNTSPEKN
ncbi:nucleoside diphosphate kinase 2, chloroplastic [Tanacetum coccineum]